MAVIVDLESYPQWAEGVKNVDVHETDDEGRPVEATFEVDAQVQRVTYRLRYTHESSRLSWRLVDSNVLTQLDGVYDLAANGDGTDVDYTIEADISIPLPGFIKKRAAKVILNTGLRGLKRRVEGG
jgi:ribosome-associated toxin RatA of RatAB toxin-antitoxin module